MTSEIESAPVGTFSNTKFKGVVHRVLPGIGFIKPEDPAGVNKFFEINGGKWKKADSREVFFHGSHVVGSEVRKGDTVEFILSADANRPFGERTVQAREIEGGSGSKVEVKLDQLERATLADRAVIEGLAEKVREQQETIEALTKYAVKVGVLEQTQKVLEDHVVSNAQKLKAMEEAMTNTLTESISRGMDSAMEKFQKKLLSGVSSQPEVESVSVACESHSLSVGSLSEAEVSTEEPESNEEEPLEKKPKKSQSSRGKGKKVGNNYNFAPSAFQAFKSNLGLGLLMMLLVIFGQVAAFGYSFGCEARVFGGLGEHVSRRFGQAGRDEVASVLIPDDRLSVQGSNLHLGVVRCMETELGDPGSGVLEVHEGRGLNNVSVPLNIYYHLDRCNVLKCHDVFLHKKRIDFLNFSKSLR